ncbi:hypothetical protein F3J09_20155 [Bacillus sp. Ab-1751]|uniref:hypothetical protein n=1 Tax=Bacillus sp. Ab-1751 TaxID=2608326 RepID=UPI00141F8BFA|nr:hypothetical protein [Bacillus sp. Ab-1751]
MSIVGKEYIRRVIHNEWGGQRQGGISTPVNHPAIFIFTSKSGGEYGYEDGWKDDITFYYTGEGQVGDMQFIKGNKAIRDHTESGSDIYLFQYGCSGIVEFLGHMCCIGYHYSNSYDRNGDIRRTIVFELQVIDIIMEEMEQENYDLKSRSLLELRSIALNEEKIVYVGKTNVSPKTKKGRFYNGHAAITKLHNPRWSGEKNYI